MEKLTLQCIRCEYVRNYESPYFEYLFKPIDTREELPSGPIITLHFEEAKDFKLKTKYFLYLMEECPDPNCEKKQA